MPFKVLSYISAPAWLRCQASPITFRYQGGRLDLWSTGGVPSVDPELDRMRFGSRGRGVVPRGASSLLQTRAQGAATGRAP